MDNADDIALSELGRLYRSEKGRVPVGHDQTCESGVSVKLSGPGIKECDAGHRFRRPPVHREKLRRDLRRGPGIQNESRKRHFSKPTRRQRGLRGKLLNLIVSDWVA